MKTEQSTKDYLEVSLPLHLALFGRRSNSKKKRKEEEEMEVEEEEVKVSKLNCEWDV